MKGVENFVEKLFDEENSYFKNVVRDALDDLRHNRQAYVFYMEQLDAVREKYKGKLKIKERDGIYYLTKVK